MKITKHLLMPALIALLSITMYSCKTKKAVAKPAPAPVAKPAPPVEEKKPEPQPVKEEPTKVEVDKPDFNFKNIQFEFNSDVLKTSSYPILDKAAAEIKKDPSAQFILNGHSSAEGSVEHNMSLSVDRANSVKSYLVNAGISTSQFTVKGFGATVPLTNNDNEQGRAINRRVEIKVLK